MKYLSVCSGIEAASCAWHGLGWTPLAFSEIEPFPSALLAERYPAVPNLGDMTKFQEWPDLEPDILVGGTPCQSFSVAGLRKGLADPRGNLTLTYLAIAARYRPAWLVWENVPGVLSDKTGAFASLVGGLAELGYGWAYRILDAQYVRVESHPRAVPQRRRRVFVVGYLGDWRRAAAVLFERESLCGHPPPRREAGQRPAAGAGWGAPVGRTIRASDGGIDREDGHTLVAHSIRTGLDLRNGEITGDIAMGIQAGGMGQERGLCINAIPHVTHSLKAEGFDASEDGTGRGVPLVPEIVSQAMSRKWSKGTSGPAGDEVANLIPVAISQCDSEGITQRDIDLIRESHPRDEECEVEVAHTIDQAQGRAIAFHNRQDPDVSGDVTHPLGAKDNGLGVGVDCYNGQITGSVAATMGTPGSSVNASGPTVMSAMQVRRLTPRECERLQGFHDDYTLITVRGKPAADGPRYRALGNAMAVNVMRWIGERIQEVA